jgi:uncharacterized repeat protein (TIGR03803 family)
MIRARVLILLGATAAGLLLCACAPNVPTSSSLPAAASSMRSNQPFTVLYSFKGGPGDGGSPQGLMLGPGGSLLGTTNDGGHIHPRDCQKTGCGTVYEYQNSTTQLLYEFQPQPQGFDPVGTLLSRNGVFYGAAQGGLYDAGMVFSLRPNASGDWTETTLYDFKGAPDGNEVGGVDYIDARGNLYGTTRSGGIGRACLFESSGCGTVFKLQPPTQPSGSWKESVLHSFIGSPTDGAVPTPSLVREGNALYGTTQLGGASARCPYVTGCGSIYKIALSGNGSSERLVYSFSVSDSQNDGALPGPIVDGGDGNLYGVTAYGGGGGTAMKCEIEVHGPYGCGTLYSIPLKHGKKIHDTILYAFTGAPDGQQPNSVSGNAASGFYGLTQYGGSVTCETPIGCGTIFAIARSGSEWNETLLHTFLGSDGAYPNGQILLIGSQLYGTASIGGVAPCECGTIYQLTVGPRGERF